MLKIDAESDPPLATLLWFVISVHQKLCQEETCHLVLSVLLQVVHACGQQCSHLVLASIPPDECLAVSLFRAQVF